MNWWGLHIELETKLRNKICNFVVEISIDKAHLNRFFPCDVSVVAKSLSSVNMVLCRKVSLHFKVQYKYIKESDLVSVRNAEEVKVC
jgi:hypothetical protein